MPAPAELIPERPTDLVGVTAYGESLTGVANAAGGRTLLATRPTATCVIEHADGTSTAYNATANTDAARGVAMLAAVAASVSGDTIVIGRGNCTYSSASPQLLKNGVNWHVTGATIKYAGTGFGSMFDTLLIGGGVAAKFTGTGTFELNTQLVDNVAWVEDQANSANMERNCVFFFGVDEDDVHIEADLVKYNPNDGSTDHFTGPYQLTTVQGSAIRHGKGKVTANIKRIEGGIGNGYYWSDGEARFRSDYVEGGSGDGSLGDSYAIWVQDSVTDDFDFSFAANSTAAMWIFCPKIHGLGNYNGVRITGSSNRRTWIYFNEISCEKPSHNSNQPCWIEGGKVYLTGQKVTGDTTGAGAGGIRCDGGFLWATIQKVSDGNTSAIFLNGGEARIDVYHVEDVASVEPSPSTSRGFQNLVRCTGGTHYVDIKSAASVGTGTRGVGVRVEGGTLFFSGNVDTSGSAAANAVEVTSGTLHYTSGRIASPVAKKDLVQTGGTLMVYPGVQYDPAKTSGTISFSKTFGVTPTTTGLAVLSGADASAVRTTIGSAATSHTHAESDITNLVSDLAAKASASSLTTHASATAAHGVSGAVVGTTDAQALTNKTISGASNTLSNIAQASVTNLTTDLAAKAVATRTITAAGLISGGGDLSANRTLTLTAGTIVTALGSLPFGATTLTAQESVSIEQTTDGYSLYFNNPAAAARVAGVLTFFDANDNPLMAFDGDNGQILYNVPIVGANADFQAVTHQQTAVFGEGAHLQLGTTSGSQIGTAANQKIGFWGHSAVVQQVLATGTGKTVDNVIAFLQSIGLCKQS